MSNATVRISLPGYDAGTDTNPTHYIFHSDYNTFKILYQGTASVAIGTGSNIYAIAHNSPINPPALAIFAKFPDGYTTSLSFNNIDAYSNTYQQLNGRSINNTYWDGTNIYLYDASVGTAYTVNIGWYVFEPQI